MLHSEDESHERTKQPVGIRQLRKRAKKEVDLLALENIDESDDDWLEEEGEVVLRADCDIGLQAVADQHTNETVPFDSVSVISETMREGRPFSHGETLDISAPTSPCGSVGQLCSSPVDIVVSHPSHPSRLSELFSDFESSSSEYDDNSQIDDLSHRLHHWYVSAKVNLKQLGMLLTELRPFHPELPKDPRTIVKTLKFTACKELHNGTYIHLGLEKGILARLKSGTVQDTSRLGLDVNIDGLQLSKSSSVEAWPILARSLDLCDSKPFTVGFFCGTSKPEPLHCYLNDFIQEVKNLTVNGILFGGEKYDVYVRSYICDAPARAYIKCIKGHAGYSACERCVQEGDHDGSRMIFESKKAAPRIDNAFQRQEDEDHHKAVSPLTELPTLFVSMFPLDPLHLLFHGVLKRFLQFLIGKSNTNARLSAQNILEISNLQDDLAHYIPREFARKPRSLAFVGRWKATELRLFLLYTGIIVMKDALEPELYSLFLLLHVASRIVSYSNLIESEAFVNYAEKLFSTFVEHSAHSSVFGSKFISYNVHSLLHLCEDVRRYGMISNFTTFPFENHLGVIKRMVRSGTHIPQQVARRLAEIDAVPDTHSPCPQATLLSPCGLNETTGQYKYLSSVNFLLTSLSSKDSFFKMGDAIGRLKQIQRSASGGVVISADICDKLENFFTYPIESIKVGVYKLGKWTARDVSIDVKSITDSFALVEFPPEKADGAKPVVSVVPSVWLEEEENLSWWPSHLKGDLALQKAISSKMKICPGFTQFTYNRILHKYDNYKAAKDRLKKAEVFSDLESAKEDILTSSKGRHIKRLKFSNVEDDVDEPETVLPKKNKKVSIPAPPLVPFEKPVLKQNSGSTFENSDEPKDTSSQDPNSHKISQITFPHSPLKRDIQGKPIFPSGLAQSRLKLQSKSLCQSLSKSQSSSHSKSHCLSSAKLQSPTNSKSLSPSPSKSQVPRSKSKSPSKSQSLSQSKSHSKSLFKPQSLSQSKSLSKPQSLSQSKSLSKPQSLSQSKSLSKPQPLSQSKQSHSKSLSKPQSLSHSKSPSPATSITSPAPSNSSPDRSRSSSPACSNSSLAHSISSSSRSNSVSPTRSSSTSSTCSKSTSPAVNTNSTRSKSTSPAAVLIETPKRSGFDLLKDVVKDIKFLKEASRNHGLILEEVLQRMKNKGVVLTHPQSMPVLPLTSMAEVLKMEDCLKSGANREYLAKRLAQEGGSSLRERVERSCKKLLQRGVAKEFSLRGKTRDGKTKEKFMDLRMFPVVEEAVFMLQPEADGKKMDEYIGYFLKMSPHRKN